MAGGQELHDAMAADEARAAGHQDGAQLLLLDRLMVRPMGAGSFPRHRMKYCDSGSLGSKPSHLQDGIPGFSGGELCDREPTR
jgi:hypothetical protein